MSAVTPDPQGERVKSLAAPAIARTTAVEAVFASLQDMISTGALGPGDSLPSQDRLAEQFAVSRNTVREAVNKLEALGFVSVRQGSGTVVNATRPGRYVESLLGHFMLEPVTVSEFVEARLVLERACVRLAADHGDAAALRDAGRELEAQAVAVEADDGRAFGKHDAAFHVALAQSSGNSVLARYVQITRDLLERFVGAGVETPGAMSLDHQRHAEILQAVEAQDATAAVDAMTTHLREAVRAAQDRLGIDFDTDALFERCCGVAPGPER